MQEPAYQNGRGTTPADAAHRRGYAYGYRQAWGASGFLPEQDTEHAQAFRDGAEEGEFDRERAERDIAAREEAEAIEAGDHRPEAERIEALGCVRARRVRR